MIYFILKNYLSHHRGIHQYQSILALENRNLWLEPPLLPRIPQRSHKFSSHCLDFENIQFDFLSQRIFQKAFERSYDHLPCTQLYTDIGKILLYRNTFRDLTKGAWKKRILDFSDHKLSSVIKVTPKIVTLTQIVKLFLPQEKCDYSY